MSNALNTNTMLWVVDETGALTNFTGTIYVQRIDLIPNAINDAITFQDAGSEDAFYLKAGGITGDTKPVPLDFGHEGRRVKGLKCSAITSSAKAYVYFRL